MTDEYLETETPKNEEGQEEEVTQEQAEKAEDVAKNYQGRLTKAQSEAKELKEKAETAEQEVKALKQTSSEKETPKKEEKVQSNEPDNTERLDKLTLKSEGITHIDDAKVVLDEAKRLKLPVEEVIAMEHIKSKLKDAKTQREAEDGMPESSGNSSGSNKTTVEYWVNKENKDGSYATPDNLELADKVIDARMKHQEDGNKFSDKLY